ncbi:hypothetical protein Tco_0386868 [Tanacetum coccineum]
MSAKSKIINNVRYITAKVAGKPVNISEASIRSDLLFDDADGIDSLHNQAIFDAIKQMGNVTPLFESMLVQPTEDEGEVSKRQSEPQPTPFSPHPSADQHETQPDPSPRLVPTIPIPDSIPKGSGGNHGEEALRNKAIMDRIINDDESCYELKRKWNIYTNYDDAYEINHEDNGNKELCEIYKPPVCNIRKYMIIKYSFNDDEEYVVVKEDEYDDLIMTRRDTCQAYQEIFRIMDEGWMVTRAT